MLDRRAELQLTLSYAESQDVNIVSNFVTWESKDGLHYASTRRRRATARSTGNSRLGPARRSRQGRHDQLREAEAAAADHEAAGRALFPSAHTILLIQRAQAGDNFMSRQVFDGATVEGAVLCRRHRTQGRTRSQRSDQEPGAAAAGLAGAPRLFPGRPQHGEARLRAGMLLLETASRATW